MRKTSLTVGAIYADLKRQPGFPKRASSGQKGLSTSPGAEMPIIRPVAERVRAIVGLVNLFHNGLISDENLLRIIGDITRE